MLITFEPFAMLVGLPGLALLLVIFRRQKRSYSYLFCFALFWVYLLIVIRLTIFPVPLVVERQPAAHVLSRVNLMPFDFGGLFELHPNVIRYELAGNILLTVPSGFFLPFLARIRQNRIPSIATLVGLAIEAAQLLVSLAIGGAYRGVDVNDVLLNAAGVLIGYGLFRAAAGMYPGLAQRWGQD